MAGWEQAGWLAFGAVLVVLFAWYFWHTAVTMVRYFRSITHYLDTRNDRLKAEIAQEAIHGRPPLWYSMVQKALILLMVAGVAAMIWMKFKGA
ncbi:hypothetical protein [Rhizobium sp.]